MMLTVRKVAPLAHATKKDWLLDPTIIRKPDLFQLKRDWKHKNNNNYG